MSTTPTLLAIPTGHRPEALRRALLSFTRDFAAHGHRIPVAVFHSARNAAEQDDVAKVAASSGAHYIGLGEKVALARVLRRATAVSPDLLALLLFNPERQAVSTGANRNACLLWSAGTRALHSDDDTLATLASHPEHTVDRSGHIETVAGDGCDYFVPSDGDVSRFMTAATARAPEGGVAGVLAAAWATAEADGTKAALAFFGLAGDCGWGAPFGFWGEGMGHLLLPDRALARIASDGRSWCEALTRRRILRCSDRLRLTRDAPGMTTSIGVDGRALLPPFFPVGRGQDALFSALAERFCDVAALQVPYAIAHEPLETRRFHDGELFRSAASIDCARAMFAFLETAAVADLPGFGRHLTALGQLDPTSFTEALRAAHRARMQRLIAAARARARGLPSLSAEWHADLEGYCGRVEESLTTDEPPWILDVGADEARTSLLRLRQLVRGYGEICEAWPSLWSAAEASAPAAALADTPPRTPSAPADRGTACSPYQSWLWRRQQLEPTDTSYVLFRAYEAREPVDVDLLEAAVRALAARHEALRLCFRSVDGEQALLELLPESAVSLRRHPPLDAPGRERERRRQALRPFALAREAPFELGWAPASEAGVHGELWLRVHHIAWDGVSEALFWRELSDVYANLRAGRDAMHGLAPIETGLRAVAARQRAGLRQHAAEHEAYWRKAIGTLGSELRVSRKAASQSKSSTSHRLRLVLPSDLARSLRDLCIAQRTTTAAMCLATWQALLSRFSGESDITVAVNVANRWEEAEEPQIGLFMTVLPTRVDLSGDPSLPVLAARNQRLLSEGAPHARLPVEQLVGVLASGRRRIAGFPAIFTHLPKPAAPRLGDAPLRELERRETQAGFELGLSIEESEGELAAVIVGHGEHYDADDIARFGRAFTSALASACVAPATAVSELDWLGGDRALLAAWNQTALDYPRDVALPEILRTQAARHPERIALSAPGTRITYGELFERAEALAVRLRALGVGRDQLVGVFLDRHPSLLESLLGVWLAGAAYLPLDPGFPRERLSFMLEDSGTTVVVTRRALTSDLPVSRAKVVCVDEPATAAATAAPSSARADDLAYVLYTSGSTGKPKGVAITQRALLNFLCGMRREIGLHENDVLLALTTVSFDIAALELWLPLLVGAGIELGGREEAADGALLAAALARSGATALQATPATWRALFAEGFGGNPRLKAMVGGEALPPDLAQRLATCCGEAWNLYGPTETTVWSAAWRIPTVAAEQVRIGRPIANTCIRILDASRREVPIGVVGEICIGGDGLARGYLNRPELNAERFIPDPVAGGEARLYRTGDRGRWLPDGLLECLGRDDDQIKLRGFRIEPGEIEAAVLQLDEIRQAAVALHEAAPGDPRLVAWVVLESDARLPARQDLRARLRGWLPEHMVPSHFVEVSALPLTPNGKVDRRALAPLFRAPEDDALVDTTASPDEARLIDAFEQLLGRKVGRDSDFFESGGDSLAAVRLIGRLAATSITPPTTGDLLVHATPRSLARHMRELEAAAAPRGGHLVVLREDGDLPAIVLLHPIGGLLAGYGSLVRHLRGVAPLFGVLAHARERPQYRTVAERCAAYVDEIMAGTNGPVALAGYSLGGVLAMECAAQLTARGREVRLVTLFDTWVPRPPRRRLEKVLFRISELRRFSWEERARWAELQLARHFKPEQEAPEAGEELAAFDVAASDELGRQALAWRPSPYAGQVLLFRSERDLRGYSNRPSKLGWDTVAPHLTVENVPVDHTRIMREPHIALIADRILRALAR